MPIVRPAGGGAIRASAARSVATTPQSAASGGRGRAAPPPGKIARLKLKNKDIQRFARNLQLQLQAGVPIVRALEVQVEEDDEDNLALIIRDLDAQLQTGIGFGEALDRYTCFPPLFPSMVRAGEASGQLPGILQSLADYLSWTEKTAKAIKKAITYPVIVLVVSSGLILFILGFLMPSFEPLFEKVDDELPTSAQVLRVGGRLVAAYWPYIVGGMVGGAIGFITFLKTTLGKRSMARAVSTAPYLRDIAFEVDIARLMRNLSVLLGSGIPLSQSLLLTRPSVSTTTLGNAVDHITAAIEGGSGFREAAYETGVFSRLAMNLISVGEEAGSMPEMFGYIGEYHDEQFTEKVERTLKLVEPIITLGLGLVVGGMAVTIIMTIYKAIMLSGR